MPPELATRLAESIRGAPSIVDYEYARRRYTWSKRLNWVTLGVCVALGVLALYFGFLFYRDWQWLHDHFTTNDSTRWTAEKIGAKLTTSIFLFVAGALGLATFFLCYFFVRPALDEDKVEDIRKWSLISAITGLIPGAVFGGLLEIFIWRAHATESFTIFGLLGPGPQAPPPAAAAPVYNPAAEEQKRKTEYEMLFAPQAAAAPQAPAFGYAPAPAAAPAYAYGAQAPAYDYTQAPAQAGEGTAVYGQAEGQGTVEAAAPAADAGTQYQQPGGAPICTCGRPMEWVPEYNRYYCYTDDKYEGET